MFSHTAPVLVFSAVTSTMWVAMLAWSFRQREHRWYNVWVLLLATVGWWLGEYVAIRLGKYEYAQFPAWLVLPLGGPRNESDWLFKALTKLDLWLGLPRVDKCVPAAASWNVPFPVVALEACLVFAFLRLSFFRLKNKGVPAAIAAASFSAVLMVTLAAILDPVASTTQWCGAPDPDPGYHGLFSVNLWHWFTNPSYSGYWFGVPLVNYVAWFVGMGAFSFLARLDDDGPRGIVRQYDRWYKYVLAAIAMVAILFLIEVPLTIGIDLVLVHGHRVFDPHLSKRAWEFGVVGALLAASLLVIRLFGKVHPSPRVEWVAIVPPLVVLGFCLIPLLYERGGVLLVVWLLSATTAIVVVSLPFIARRLHKSDPPRIPSESGVDG